MNLHEEMQLTVSRHCERLSGDVIIWGAGNMAVYLVNQLRLLGARVICCVEPEAPVPPRVFDIPVIPPSDLAAQRHDNVPILIATKWWREAGSHLMDLGYTHGDDFLLAQRGVTTYPWIPDRGRDTPTFIGKHCWMVEKEFLCTHYRVNRVVRIGAFCSVAKGAIIVAQHPYQNSVSTFMFDCFEEFGGSMDDAHLERIGRVLNAPTEIGNDVWIGHGAVIMPGVTIGNGAIIASNAVVTKDVPAYAVCGGVPARVLRYRFEPEQIDAFQSIEWWTWPDHKIKRERSSFHAPEAFLSSVAEQSASE